MIRPAPKLPPLLVQALLATSLALPAAGEPPAASRTPAAVACDANRLLGFLQRTTIAAPPDTAGGVNLTLTPSGAFQGLAYAVSPSGAETLLAFSVLTEGSTLLRNPERPQLASFSISRNDLASDLVGQEAAVPIGITVDPTLAPRPDEPDPEELIVLDNLPTPGGRSSARPGRGLNHLLAPCHGPLTDEEAHALQVLARVARIEGSGPARVAIYPGSASDEIRIDAVLGEAAGAGGRLSATVRVTRDSAGRLLGGVLQVLPACQGDDRSLDCSTAPPGTALRLRQPAFRGTAPGPGPSAAVAPFEDGAAETVPIDWFTLLAGTTWRPAQERPTPSLALELAVGPLLVVTAHPDDEVLLAPLLGEVCVELDGSCAVAVATRGERGTCLLPDGCLPDLATVRAAEMERAAALLGAGLELWSLPDGPATSPSAVRAAWSVAAGGERALLDRVTALILESGAQTVVTFDPRHGSTGHGDHRAIGRLVLDAVVALPAAQRPAVLLLETRVEIDSTSRTTLSPDGEASPLLTFDARRWMVRLGGPAWDYLVRDARIHASQPAPELVDALESVPSRSRRVWLHEPPTG